MLAEEFFEPGAPDMLPLVTRIMHYNPDLIDFDGASPGDAVNIAKVARAQGYKNLMSKIGGGGDVCFGAAPEALEGFMFNLEADMTVTTGKQAELIAEVKRRKPQVPIDSFVPKVYAVVMMLAKAMQNAGTVEDTDAVRLALERLDNFESVGGKYGWTGKDVYGINHQLKAPFVLTGGIGGKMVTLASLTWY
jgi:branched-chain amino acid transport system substrate-binding protein